MHVHHTHEVPMGTRSGRQNPRIGVTASCEAPCGSWAPNPGPLQVQQVLLTAKPSSSTIQHLSEKFLVH